MTNPTDPHDPYAARPDRNDPDNPGRDPNSEIFSSRSRDDDDTPRDFTPTPTPSESPTYDVIDPNAHNASADAPTRLDHRQAHPPQLDPFMVAPPPDPTLAQDPYAPYAASPSLGPPPLTPPVSPGALLRTHNGGVILTLGVISIAGGALGTFCCGIFGLVGLGCGIGAVTWASSELRAVNAGIIDPSGRSVLNAGRICGIVGICLAALSILIFVGMLVLSVAAGP